MQNLKELRIERGLSQKELASHVGVDRTSIGKYEMHDVLPSREVLFKLADYFDVSMDYLLGYKNSNNYLTPQQRKLIDLYEHANEQAKRIVDYVLNDASQKTLHSKKAAEELSIIKHFKQPHINIPVVGRAAAGMPIEMIQSDNGSLSIDDDKIQYGDFAVIAVGDSMIGAGICDGDRVVIRPQPTVENGELALVAIDNDSTIKRFHKDYMGFKLVPANPNHSIQQYPPDYPVRILGKVVKVIKEAEL